MTMSAGEQPGASGSADPQQGLEGTPPADPADGSPRGIRGHGKGRDKRHRRDDPDGERNVGG
jgi:hypothetical protein